MGAAFCVKNIAEAECATREHVSARKRACPKLLVVGRKFQKVGPARTVAGRVRHATCHHALHKLVARTLRPQLRRSAGGARLFAKYSAKRPPFWGPERGP